MFNICVICAPRTRSTFFTKVLESYYGIENYFEYLNYQNYNKFNPAQLSKIFLEKRIVEKKELIFNTFKENQTKFSKKIQNDNKDYVLKFWTRCIITKFSTNEETTSNKEKDKSNELNKNSSRYIFELENYNPYIITNLSEIFNLDTYTQYYFLTRNITDNIASLIYAEELDFYVALGNKNKPAKVALEYQKKRIKNKQITINYNLPRIKFNIFELALTSFLENYLIEKKLNYVKLDYDEIPSYVDNNLMNENTSKLEYEIVPSNFNYKELITNYKELDIFANDYYNRCINHINNLGIHFY